MKNPAIVLALSLALGSVPVRVDGAEIVKVGPGSRTRLQDLLSKPDDTIIQAGNGKTITVGELKQRRTAARRKSSNPQEDADGAAAASRRLHDELVAGNAAAQSALLALQRPHSNIPPKSVIPTPMPTAKPGTIETVDGKLGNFQIQPTQRILLNGQFAGMGNGEVRVAGNFPPLGYLVLNVLDHGNDYFYCEVPDVTGAPDQPVVISIRFFSGPSASNGKAGIFHAKRTSSVHNAGAAVCGGLVMSSTDAEAVPEHYGDDEPGLGCRTTHWAGNPFQGQDTWKLKKADQGFRIVGLWWASDFGTVGQTTWSNGVPSVPWKATDDYWSHTGYESYYGITKLHIEGPAGVSPF